LVQDLLSSCLSKNVKIKIVLRRIFGPKGEEVGLWKKLHNDELHSLYSSPNTVTVIKSRKMKWVGHGAHIREGRGIYGILV
jgi:hypothetical protein